LEPTVDSKGKDIEATRTIRKVEEDQAPSDLITIATGEVKINEGFGFVGNVFVGKELIEKLKGKKEATVKAIPNFNKKKDSWGRLAVAVVE
jgi:hypothetical protein